MNVLAAQSAVSPEPDSRLCGQDALEASMEIIRMVSHTQEHRLKP